jgi:tetratricopeptide (TPR) repeat protein
VLAASMSRNGEYSPRREADECEATGLWFAAAHYLGKVLASNPPDSAKLLIRRAQANARLRTAEALEQAATDYDAAMAKDTAIREDWRNHAGLARVYVASQDWRKAFEHYDAATDLNSENWELWEEMGNVAVRVEDWERAARSFESAAKHNGTRWQLREALAKAQSALGGDKWEKAAENFGEAIRLNGPRVNLLAQRARAYAELGGPRLKDAEKDLEDVFNINKYDFEAARALALVRLKGDENQADKSKGYLETCNLVLQRLDTREALPPVTTNSAAWVLVLARPQGLGQDGAKRLTERAVELASKSNAGQRVPRNGEFLNPLGVAYYRAGKLDDAIKTLNEARAARSPERMMTPVDQMAKSSAAGETGTPWDWVFLAMAYQARGDTEEAIRLLKAAEAVAQQYKSRGASDPTNPRHTWLRMELEYLLKEAQGVVKQ